MEIDKKHIVGKVWVNLCRFLLGALFIFSGFVKAVDPLGFFYKIQDYLTAFGMISWFPSYAPLLVGIALSAIEFSVGVFLFLGIRRMRAHAARRGYNLTHLSRPVRTEDFYNFDLIIGMDDCNIDDLKDRAPSTAEWSKIHRMTEYCTKFTHADHVPDPYYGGSEGFEYVLDILEDACAGLLQSI